MTRWHPALIALGVIAALALLGLWGAANHVQELYRGMQWSGETPPEEVTQAWALSDFLHWLAMPALSTATAACVIAIALVVVFGRMFAAPAQSTSATRTTSAAGSTENRTATTSPNSSPSISNSWGSPSTTSSTERPRE